MSFRVHRVSDEPGERPTRRWTPLLLLIVKIAGPIVSWARAVQQRQQQDERRARRIGVLKRILIILIAVLCAFLLLAGLANALLGIRILSLDTVFTVAGSDLPRDDSGDTNVLLLGSGDASHDGKDLTDTIMVASIDPETESVLLLSIPRDLYMLKTEKMGAGRINSLYRDYKGYLKYKEDLSEAEASKRAIAELGAEVGRMLGIDMHAVAKIDFIGFVQAIDEIGGVDVDVPYDIEDVEYPGPDYTFETFTLPKGSHHLDGETALKYARSRHTTSDFGRSARQQQLLQALSEKVRNDGLLRSAGRITSLLGIIGDHTESTMSTRQIIGLAGLVKGFDHPQILSMQLSDRNGLYDGLPEPGGLLYNPPRDAFEGASVLLPVSIPEFPVTWRQIQLFVDLLQTHRSVRLGGASIGIYNAGAKPGLARKLANELTRFGFPIANIANADNRDAQTSSIRSSGDGGEASAQLLSDLLGIPMVQPSEGALPPSADIYLGKEYVYQPLQETYQPQP